MSDKHSQGGGGGGAAVARYATVNDIGDRNDAAAAAAVPHSSGGHGGSPDGTNRRQDERHRQQQWRRLSLTTINSPTVDAPAGGPVLGDCPGMMASVQQQAQAEARMQAQAQTRAQKQQLQQERQLSNQAGGQPPHRPPHPAHPPPVNPALKAQATLSARYYGECAQSSIPPPLADNAVRAVHTAFQYWWDQRSLGERMVGTGDAGVTGLRVGRMEEERADGGEERERVRPERGRQQRRRRSARDDGDGDGRPNRGSPPSGGSRTTDAPPAAGAAATVILDETNLALTSSRLRTSPPTANIITETDVSEEASVVSAAVSDTSSQRRARRPKKRKERDIDRNDEGDDLSASGDSGHGNKRAQVGRRVVAGPDVVPPHRHEHRNGRANEQHERIRPSPSTSVQLRASLQSHKEIRQSKTSLLRALAVSSGDVTAEPFLFALDRLRKAYAKSGLDRDSVLTNQGQHAQHNAQGQQGTPRKVEGMWLTLSRPNYHDCLGQNPTSEYMYTLGRMSFGMFRPPNLVCSVQGVFNPVHVVDGMDRDEVESVPRSLRGELRDGKSVLRTYNIVTAFTIEPTSPSFPPNSPNAAVVRPIRGIMTTYGYVLPDPQTPNRLSVWFTGGTVEVNDVEDMDEWAKVFGGSSGGGGDSAGPSLQERAKLLAAKLLLGASAPDGMEEDGTMTFQLKRPVGGHGSAYVDILYLDDTLRIMQGHHGSLYVMARVPSVPEDD